MAIAPAAQAQRAVSGVEDTAYVAGEFRVFTGSGVATSLEAVVAAMGQVDVVFIGETHDDPTGHMLEAQLFARADDTYGSGAPPDSTGRPIVLSLEFFERDVQLILDEYLTGLISEKSFRDESRPWPRYETDYRPLIEFAKEHDLPVIAANAPRRYIARVTMHGRESLEDLSPEALRTLAPLPYGQPSPEYRRQWIATIMDVMQQEGKKCGLPIAEGEGGDSTVRAPAPVGSHEQMGNQLHSQTLWDATMAYAISEALAQRPDALVLHIVGGFHVARGTGIPEHLDAYRPGTSRLIVMMRPVDDIDAFEPAPEGQWGDFVIQTDESHTLEAIECRRYLAERSR